MCVEISDLTQVQAGVSLLQDGQVALQDDLASAVSDISTHTGQITALQADVITQEGLIGLQSHLQFEH